jgi:hypothetical protein
MSLHPTITNRAETLARIVYQDHPAMQIALRAAIEGLCTLAWTHGYRDAIDHAQPPAERPTTEVEALADAAIRRAQR